MIEVPKLRSPQANMRYLLFLIGLAAIIIILSLIFRRMTIPVLGGLFFAYLCFPVVRFIERRLRIRLFFAAAVVISSVSGLVIFGVFQLVPAVYFQISEILDLVPEAFKLVELKWLPLLRESVAEIGFPEFVTWLDNVSLTGIIRQFGNRIGLALEQLWIATPSVLGHLLNVVLIPVIALVAIIEHERISRALLSLVPIDTRTSVFALAKRLDIALSAVIIGQLIIAASMGVFYMIGLGAIGLSSGVAIGAIAGICRIVPYLDLVVGVGLSLIVILTEFSSWSQVIAMFGVFLAAQSIDGMFLTPKIIGKRVGLHPLVVVMAILAFFDWFGFSGIILALPVVAVMTVVGTEFVDIYKLSKFYSSPTATDSESSPSVSSL